MVDGVSRARRQLARRAWLRRRLPAAIVTTTVPLGVIAATAWVSPRTSAPVDSARPVDPRIQAGVSRQAATQAAALRSLRATLSNDEAQIAALPRPSRATGSLGLAPLPSLTPVPSFSPAPASHATTGASSVP